MSGQTLPLSYADADPTARKGISSFARALTLGVSLLALGHTGLAQARTLLQDAPPASDVLVWSSKSTIYPTPHTNLSSFPITAADFPDPTPPDGIERRVHWHCNGTGTPLVIFAHGHGGTLWDWSWTQRMVAANTRTCSYSRQGYGYSTRGARPSDIRR